MRPKHLPIEEIRLAARTGFLSKPIWEEFFAKGSDRWRRRQWQLLTERGYFVRHPSRLPRDVLVLYRKHPEVRQLVGESIGLPPIAPQIEHDECVTRILLDLNRGGHMLGFQFEAEMKRLEWGERRLYRSSERDKFPDAILTVSGPNGVFNVALEIELSRKSPKRYRQILTSYATRKDLNCVLFLARSQIIFENLKIAMRQTIYPDWERPIGFCNLDNWLNAPARAPIYFSDKQITLTEMTKR